MGRHLATGSDEVLGLLGQPVGALRVEVLVRARVLLGRRLVALQASLRLPLLLVHNLVDLQVFGRL